MTLDRNRFLLLAAAIGGASCTTTNENPSGDASLPDTSVSSDGGSDTAAPEASVEAGNDAADSSTEASAEAGACDDDTGQGGKAKYCPLAETGSGCLTTIDCNLTVLKAGSELRYFDCLANAPLSSCATEGTPDAHATCAAEMINDACSDPASPGICAQILTACADAGVTIAEQDCENWINPLSEGGQLDFVSCVTESGCSLDTVRACTGYLQ